jgi:hypothetical protein
LNAIKGAVIAVISSLLVALLFAYIFRIPIPLGGMLGPFGELNPYSLSVVDVIKSVLVAWVFYGVFGGFIIVPLFGAITGVIVGRKHSGASKQKMIVIWSFFASVIPVFLLSVLDYVIGPW